jgi:hypothetical protein
LPSSILGRATDYADGGFLWYYLDFTDKSE